MIEVTAHNGDWAEAPDAESALVAARVLWDEASRSLGRPTITFEVRDEDGKLVFLKSVCNRRELG